MRFVRKEGHRVVYYCEGRAHTEYATPRPREKRNCSIKCIIAWAICFWSWQFWFRNSFLIISVPFQMTKAYHSYILCIDNDLIDNNESCQNNKFDFSFFRSSLLFVDASLCRCKTNNHNKNQTQKSLIIVPCTLASNSHVHTETTTPITPSPSLILFKMHVKYYILSFLLFLQGWCRASAVPCRRRSNECKDN